MSSVKVLLNTHFVTPVVHTRLLSLKLYKVFFISDSPIIVVLRTRQHQYPMSKILNKSSKFCSLWTGWVLSSRRWRLTATFVAVRWQCQNGKTDLAGAMQMKEKAIQRISFCNSWRTTENISDCHVCTIILTSWRPDPVNNSYIVPNAGGEWGFGLIK